MDRENISKKELSKIGVSVSSLKNTLLNNVYSFDDEFQEKAIAELSKKGDVSLSMIIEIVESFLAAVEERIENAGELDLSAFEESNLKTRRASYKEKLFNLQKIKNVPESSPSLCNKEEATDKEHKPAAKERSAGVIKSGYAFASKAQQIEADAAQEKEDAAEAPAVKEPAEIAALREAVAWWLERVTSKNPNEVPYTERKNNETPAWFDAANTAIREYEAGAVSPQRAEELNDLASMRTDIDRLEAKLAEATKSAESFRAGFISRDRKVDELKHALREVIKDFDLAEEIRKTHGFNDAAAEFKIGMSAKINSLRELTK